MRRITIFSQVANLYVFLFLLPKLQDENALHAVLRVCRLVRRYGLKLVYAQVRATLEYGRGSRYKKYGLE